MPRRGTAHGRAGVWVDRQHQLIRISRRLRRNRVPRRQGRGQRLDDGDRSRAERARGARQCRMPRAKTRLSTGAEYEAHIRGLHERGLLDEASMQAALDAPPPQFVAPMYAYLASDLSKDVTGQIFIAAGGFVGRFDRPAPSLLGYRDHQASPPWSVAELHDMIG